MAQFNVEHIMTDEFKAKRSIILRQFDDFINSEDESSIKSVNVAHKKWTSVVEVFKFS